MKSLIAILRLALILSIITAAATAQSGTRVSILVDAFGQPSRLQMDWGFSAMVEHNGRRILFDTGNNADIFAANVKRLGVELKNLDFVVISHRHGDHTDGLRHLLKVNPNVKVYAPNDEYFGGPTPPHFYRRSDPTLSAEMRYFGGSPPTVVPHGTAWPKANIERVDNVKEVIPGIRLVPTGSQDRGTSLPELSLSLSTPEGEVLIVGCSHPGIENILQAASQGGQRFRMIFGGFHWLTMPEAEIERLASSLQDKWKVAEVAPGHCTGEPGFAILKRKFGERFKPAGVGTIVNIGKRAS